MCGIAAIAIAGDGPADCGPPIDPGRLDAMTQAQRHRGPDATGRWLSPDARLGLGHARLKIIDLSSAADQPMVDPASGIALAFNGEIYNYRELRDELAGYGFRTQSDSEVLLAAWARWGRDCLHRLVGMFAFVVCDPADGSLVAVRDRFGVKPLHWHHEVGGNGSTLRIASEIKALVADGVPRRLDATAWATWLVHGLSDHSARTFFEGVNSLPAGHLLEWRNGRVSVQQWYSLAERVAGADDARPLDEIRADVAAHIDAAVDLRFRSDVPVGICLSGGLDSSLLLATVDRGPATRHGVTAFTFVTHDERYDELEWVRGMLAATQHPLETCALTPQDVIDLTPRMAALQDAPFSGVPVLAYSRVFARARERGTLVLLDGNGMDEQWAGYDYYARVGTAHPSVQGSSDPPVRPGCLLPAFRALAEDAGATVAAPTADAIRNRQLRDFGLSKLPRALRFTDRVSMAASVELREPFLDHRLVELSLRQRADLKIRDGVHKWLIRQITEQRLPAPIALAPKRPLQTPQREWLRDELSGWVDQRLDAVLRQFGGEWFDADAVRAEWAAYRAGGSDNSFYVWQWLSLADFL